MRYREKRVGAAKLALAWVITESASVIVTVTEF
jgi:hypothetical protein